MKPMVVVGMSGVSKTVALKMLEDMEFYRVDNLPISLVDKFVQLTPGNEDIAQAALGIDIRSDEEPNHLDETLRGWRNTGPDFQVLFLDANGVALIKHYKGTCHSHPLAGTGRLGKGIEKERVKLAFLKKGADFIIDTSKFFTKKPRQELGKTFLQDKGYNNMLVTVLSSGFKYGIPEDAGLVSDVRFLPNPYYMEELHPLTGEDQVIHDYVIQGKTKRAFLNELHDMMDFLLPNYIDEEKNQLVIAMGYTRGKYRSVAMADTLCGHFAAFGEYRIRIEHGGTDKGSKRK